MPTVNPPGENYREICELVAARLARARASRPSSCAARATPGDSDRYPRWNLVARREGGAARALRALQRPHRRGRGRPGLDHRPVRRRADRRPDLRPRHLRHEGRARRGDRRGRGLPRAPARTSPARSRSPPPPTRRPAATAASRTWRGSATSTRRVDHVIIPEPLEQGPGLPRASRRLVGRARDLRPHRPRLDAVPRRLRGAAHGRGARRDGGEPLCRRSPRGARRCRWCRRRRGPRRLNINSLHGGQAEPPADFTGWPAPVVPDRCRMVIDRRFLAEEDIAEVKAEFRATVERAREPARISATRSATCTRSCR